MLQFNNVKMPRPSTDVLLERGPLGERFAADSPDPAERIAGEIQNVTANARTTLIQRWTALQSDASLSASGRVDAVMSLGEGLLAEIARETDNKLDNLQGDANQATNLVNKSEEDEATSGDQAFAEMRRREVRDVLRGMGELDRAQALTKAIATGDAETARAALHAPAVLELLTGAQRDEFEAQWLEARFPQAFARAKRLAEVVETVRADVECTTRAIHERCSLPIRDDFYVAPPEEAMA